MNRAMVATLFAPVTRTAGERRVLSIVCVGLWLMNERGDTIDTLVVTRN